MIERFFKVIFFGVFYCVMVIQGLAGEDQNSLRPIAVMEFEAKGVTQLEASTLTDRFRSELVQTKAFIQIERNKIEQIFREQKLQMTGTVSDDQLVEIGEMLGAELLVVGSIGKLGSTYTIDLRLVEVESGEILASYFKDYRGEVDGLLGQFRIIAGEIAGKGMKVPDKPKDKAASLVSNKVATTISHDAESVQSKAKRDAAEDFSAFPWGAGGMATGTAGGCLMGPTGGLLATGLVVGVGYMKDANPPQERLSEVNSSGTTDQKIYIQTYEQQIKKHRTKWSAGGGLAGCCVGSILAAMILSSTASY